MPGFVSEACGLQKPIQKHCDLSLSGYQVAQHVQACQRRLACRRILHCRFSCQSSQESMNGRHLGAPIPQRSARTDIIISGYRRIRFQGRRLAAEIRGALADNVQLCAVTTTMVPEMVPKKIAPSNLKALGLEISMAPAPAPRRRQVSAQRGSGLGVCRARRYAQRRVKLRSGRRGYC